MNQQIVVHRDTVKTIRRRIYDSLDTFAASIQTPNTDSNLLVVNHVNTEASQSKATIRIVPQKNSNGEMSYLYLNSDDDLIMVDKPFVNESTDSAVMTNTFYASDTIKPSDYQFGIMSRANVHYPSKAVYQPMKTTNDDIAQVVYFPLMVLITIGYLHRCITSGAWSRLGSELKAAWVA